MAITSHADEARDRLRFTRRRRELALYTSDDITRLEEGYKDLEALVNIMNRQFPKMRTELERLKAENERLRRENEDLRKRGDKT